MRTVEIDNELILVEVPKEAKEFELIKVYEDYALTYFINRELHSTKYLGKEEMQIIGLIETPDLDFDFDANNIQISCSISCSPIDFCKGGICDKNGCLGDNNLMIKTRIQRKIQDAGIELKGNLLLIKKV